MVCHKEFENAGKKAGLEVWRIKKMDLEPVPVRLHGQFYTGDTYILLLTVSGPSYHVFSWTGSVASVDEKGAAAIFMMQLDDFLGGMPLQHTEFQNEESALFLSNFKHGITYKIGGFASGLKRQEKKEVNRLIHVRGHRAIRGTEVPLDWKSFNKSDCFVIDLGEKIFHWSGSGCNRYERLKTTEIAIEIRDNERGGSPKLEFVDEGDEPEEVLKVLGPKPELPSSTVEDDKASDKKHKNEASLYLISDATGTMTATMKAEKNPFEQNMLSQKECYILDNGGNNMIFVWKGQEANKDERKVAFAVANKFIKDKNYPPNTRIEILPANAESGLFKQFFTNWLDKEETTGPSQAYVMGGVAKVLKVKFDSSSLHDNQVMAAQYGMVDDGSGTVKIWRVEGGDKVLVDPASYGQFYGGDCYLVQYTYNTGARDKHIIYIWQGQTCSQDELVASAFMTVKLDDSMGGIATQVRLSQGKETPHFVSMFKDQPMVIHLGGTSRKGGDCKPGSTRLFHIRQDSTKATRAVEVKPTAESLNTNDILVLKTPDDLFCWKGKGSTPEEMVAAKHLAKMLEGTWTEVEETKEPAKFWAALGGKQSYQTSRTLQNMFQQPRLFGISNATGNVIAEEIPPPITQMDLAPDDVMILDTNCQVFLWIGKDANEAEKHGGHTIAREYLRTDPAGRVGTPFSIIRQGQEPLSFVGWFQGWDNNLWSKDPKEVMQACLKR